MNAGKHSTVLGASLGLGASTVRSGPSRGAVQFHPRSEAGERLRSQFRSQTSGGVRLHGAAPTGGTQLLVPGRAGLFNLSAYETCRKGASSRPPGDGKGDPTSPAPKSPVPKSPAPGGAELAKAGLARNGLAPQPGLVASLGQLHDRLSEAASKATPASAYNFDLLLTTLMSQASIRELSESPDDSARAKATAGLGALVDTLLESIEPGRDGFALNRLLGQSSALDGAIEALRVDVMVDFLREVEGSRKESKYGFTFDSEGARSQARDLVKHDLALATARNQLHNALAEAGLVRTLGGLAGLKVDTALITGLRKSLGDDASRVGLITAHMLFLDQAATTSGPARQMLATVDAALAQTRRQRQSAADTLAHLAQAGVPDSRRATLAGTVRQLDATERYLLSRRNALLPDSLVAAADLIQGLSGEPARGLAAPDAPDLADQIRRHFAPRTGTDSPGARPTATAILARERSAHARLARALAEPGPARQASQALSSHLRANFDKAVREDPTGGIDACRRFRAAVDLLNDPLLNQDPQLQGHLDRLCSGLRGFDPESLRVRPGSGREITVKSLKTLSHDDGLMAAVDAVITLCDRGPGIRARLAESASRIAQLESRCEHELRDVTRAAVLLHAGQQGASTFKPADRVAIKATLKSWGVNVDAPAARTLVDQCIAQPLSPQVVRAWRQSSGRDDVPVSQEPASPLSATELHQLGLSAEEERTVIAEVHKFAKLGLSSASEAQAVMNTTKAIVGSLTQGDRLSGLATGHPASINGTRDEDKARLLGNLLAHKLLGVATTREAQAPGSGTPLPTTDQRDALAVRMAATLTRQGQPLARLTDDATLRGLRADAAKYERAVAELDRQSGILEKDTASPREKEAARQAQGEAVNIIEKVLASRASIMGSDASAALRDAVRVATLMQLGDRQVLHTFRPPDHLPAIHKTLATWGLPVDSLRPEIDSLLAESFGPDELDLWREQAGLSPDASLQARREIAEAQKHYPTGVSHETRERLIDSILKVPLPARARVRVTSGQRADVQTGRIPIDLFGTFGVNLRGAGTVLDAMELAFANDGLELQLRKGGELRVGVQASARVPGLQADLPGGTQLGADATVGLEVAGSMARGVSMRFPNDEAGRRALSSVVDALLQGKEPDLSQATTVALLSEGRKGVKVSAMARLAVALFSSRTSGDTARDVSRHLGVSASARTGVSASHQRTRMDAGNSRIHVTKTERDTALEASASLAISSSVGIPVPQAEGGIQKAGSDHLEAGRSMGINVKRQTREIRNEIGEFDRLTEQYASMFLPATGRELAIRRLGGAPLERLIVNLRQSTALDDKAAAKAIGDLMASTGKDEALTLSMAIDPDKLTAINALVREARNLRTGASGSGSTREALQRADALDKRIRGMVEDPDNYYITCIDVVANQETSRTDSLNLHFVKTSAFVETKGTYVASRILVPADVARKSRLEALGLSVPAKEPAVDRPPARPVQDGVPTSASPSAGSQPMPGAVTPSPVKRHTAGTRFHYQAPPGRSGIDGTTRPASPQSPGDGPASRTHRL